MGPFLLKALVSLGLGREYHLKNSRLNLDTKTTSEKRGNFRYSLKTLKKFPTKIVVFNWVHTFITSYFEKVFYKKNPPILVRNCLILLLFALCSVVRIFIEKMSIYEIVQEFGFNHSWN